MIDAFCLESPEPHNSFLFVRSACRAPEHARQYGQLSLKLPGEVVQILKSERRGNLLHAAISCHQLMFGTFYPACLDVFVRRQAGRSLE